MIIEMFLGNEKNLRDTQKINTPRRERKNLGKFGDMF